MSAADVPARAIYRGWWVLAGLFFIYAASNGLAFHSLPLLYPELIRDFGWSEAQVTLPATVFFIVGAITSPPAGALLDRFSARAVIFVGAVGMVLCLAAYGQVTALWQLVLLYAVLGLSLSLGGLVSNMVVVSRWFERLRGRAVGILLMASSLGGVVFPLVMGGAIESVGWRGAVGVLTGIAAAMLFLPLLFLVRDRPQDLGLAPDGDATRARSAAATPAASPSSTAKAAALPGAAVPPGARRCMIKPPATRPRRTSLKAKRASWLATTTSQAQISPTPPP